MPIIAAISNKERRLMRKEARQTRDKNYARRIIAMLMLHRGILINREQVTTICVFR